MSQSHSRLGASALNWRSTRSSCAGGPAFLPLGPRFLPNTLHHPVGRADPPHGAVARDPPSAGSLVGQEPVTELRVVSVSVEQGVRQVRLLELPGAHRGLQPAVVWLSCELEDPHVTTTGIPSAASSLTSG